VPEIVQGLKKVTCSQGKAARFEAVIHGQPPPTVTWFDVSTFCMHVAFATHTENISCSSCRDSKFFVLITFTRI